MAQRQNSNSKVSTLNEYPKTVQDKKNRKTYQLSTFLGKGGFGRCFQAICTEEDKNYAAKVIEKRMLAKGENQERLRQEIKIHKTLDHPYIVKFITSVEDKSYVTLILELCERNTLMELVQRRFSKYNGALLELEAGFFFRQILLGVEYLHKSNIIHRDLKLANIFINSEINLKIGDFGLAVQLKDIDEKFFTCCGTPNYIAPEVIDKTGHSLPADVWSLGCILYAMLIGHPPFEKKTLEMTYKSIAKVDFEIPNYLSHSAYEIVCSILKKDPEKRPTVQQLLTHSFVTDENIPNRMPESCLFTTPRLVLKNEPFQYSKTTGMIAIDCENFKNHLGSLLEQLTEVLQSSEGKSDQENVITDYLVDFTTPKCRPYVWISKWVDYSEKYGFGYQLSNESVGIFFNDHTKLTMFANDINIHFIDHGGNENYYTYPDIPKELEKKHKLLVYFKRYMNQKLISTCSGNYVQADDISRTPYTQAWIRSDDCTMIHLSNGSSQFNFLEEHRKILLCPLMKAVTILDNDNSMRTYTFNTLIESGHSLKLNKNLKFAYTQIEELFHSLKQGGAETEEVIDT